MFLDIFIFDKNLKIDTTSDRLMKPYVSMSFTQVGVGQMSCHSFRVFNGVMGTMVRHTLRVVYWSSPLIPSFPEVVSL